MNAREQGRDQAIAWVIRTRDPAFDDWDGFTAWLEQSEEHARLYDALSLADEQIAEGLAVEPAAGLPLPANDVAPQRRWWLAGGIAAAIAVAGTFLVTTMNQGAFPAQDYRTAPGERRSVQLADGSRVEMNGSTHLVIDGERHARLEQGQALFTIVHDDKRPFELASGNDIVRDLGTVFDVTRTGRTFTVTVSEGLILFNPDEEAVRVPAGKSLEESGDRLVVRAVATDQVGGWREGRLSYEGAPIARVAEDLSRNLGVEVSADPGVASRPFSGIIQIEGGGRAALANAADILGVQLRRSGDKWVLAGR
jgi:transmembrane sensor